MTEDDDVACTSCAQLLPIIVRNDTNSPVSVVAFVNTKNGDMMATGVMDALDAGAARRFTLAADVFERVRVPSVFFGTNLPAPRLVAGDRLEDQHVAASHSYLDLQDLTAASCVVVDGPRGRPVITCERSTRR